MLVHGDKSDTLRLDDLSSGKSVAVVSADLPAGSDYAVGNFRGSPLRELLVYKPGDKSLTVRPVEEATAGQFQLGAGQNFDLAQPVLFHSLPAASSRRATRSTKPKGRGMLPASSAAWHRWRTTTTSPSLTFAPGLRPSRPKQPRET